MPLVPEPLPELQVIELEHRYHDDEPVHGAPFELRLSDGRVVHGRLDDEGRARIEGVAPGVAHVRFGPDRRPWERVDQRPNPAFAARFSQSDAGALVRRHLGGRR